jgi:hypothetical protein
VAGLAVRSTCEELLDLPLTPVPWVDSRFKARIRKVLYSLGVYEDPVRVVKIPFSHSCSERLISSLIPQQILWGPVFILFCLSIDPYQRIRQQVFYNSSGSSLFPLKVDLKHRDGDKVENLEHL